MLGYLRLRQLNKIAAYLPRFRTNNDEKLVGQLGRSQF